MRILHVCETARGGVGTYIDTLVALCRPEDFQQVILPEQHRSMLAASVSCRTFAYPSRSVLSLIRMLWVALVGRFEFRPDIIFCHSSLALCALVLLKPISPRIAFVYCPHGWAGLRQGVGSWKSWFARRIEGLLCGMADRVVNVSNSEFSHARQHAYCGNHVVIENAVLPGSEVVSAEAPPLETDSNVLNLLFVGRHDFEKGLDILLAAFAIAHERRADLRLHIIGEAVVSSANHLGNRTATPDSAAISWLGWLERRKIDAYYQSADLVIVPSRREGLPLVIPEALRNGTPVLVSDRSGLPGLITPGETGFVCPADSHVLADMLAGLQKSELGKMRASCVALFRQRYHAERLGQEIHALYETMLCFNVVVAPRKSV